MAKLKTYSKLTDAIEMIFGILVDKNSTIKILQNENENLINKNFVLNKENMALNFEIKKLKQDLNVSINDRDETLSNNVSQITINKCNNLEALQNYQKLLEKQKEDELQKNIDDLDLSCSSNSKRNEESNNDDYEAIIKKYILESTNSLDFNNSNKKI